MADSINKAIIIDVRLTDKEILTNMTELADKMSVLKTRMNENKRETEAQKLEYETLKTELKSVTKEYNVLASVQSGQVTASNEKLNGSYVQLYENLKKLDFELKTAPGLIKQNADGTTTLTDKYFELQKQADDAQKTILLFNAGISQGRLNVGNYDNTLSGMRQHLEDLKKSMETINVDSPEFKKAKDDAANLGLQIDQLSDKVDEFGNKEPKNPAKKTFDDAFESSVALTSGISLIMSLTKDNEDVQRSLAEAMKSVAIAQTAANILKSKGAILDTANIIITKTRTAVTWLWTQATVGATAAQTALNIAVNSFVVVAIIAGIVKLIDWLRNLKGAQDAAAESNSNMVDKFQQATMLLESNNQDLRDRIELLKAQGKSETELYNAKRDLINKEIEDLKRTQGFYREGSENYDIYAHLITDRTKKLQLLESEHTQTVKEQTDARNKQRQSELKSQAEIDFQNKELLIKTTTDGQVEVLELFDLYAQKRKDDAKEKGLDVALVEKDIAQQRAELIDKYNKEVKEKSDAAFQEYLDTQKTNGQKLFDALASDTEREINAVDTKYLELISLADGNGETIAALNKKWADEITAIEQKAADDKKKIDDDLTQQRIDNNKRVADIIIDTASSVAGILQDINQTHLDNELQSLEKQHDAKRISDAQYERSVANAKKKSAQNSKAVAIFQSIINTARAIAESLPNIPLSILAGVLGGAQTAVIAAQKIPQFEQGGGIQIGGKRHSQGGTKFFGTDGTRFEAEQGEGLYIVKRNAQSFINKLSGINKMFGGNDFSIPVSGDKFQDGGFVVRQMSRDVNNEMNDRRFVIDAVKQLPAPVVLVSEMNRVVDSEQQSIEVSNL